MIAPEQLPPPRALAPLRGDAFVFRRPIEIVLFDFADEGRDDDQWRAQHQFLQHPRWAVPRQPRQETVRVVAYFEAPTLPGNVIAHQLDVARIAHTQAVFVRQADVFDAERVEPHQLGGDGVDGDLICRGQDDVLLDGPDHARPGSISGGRAVHHREDAGVDFLLDRQQVHERFVNPRVGVVPVFAQQTAESVLHRAGVVVYMCVLTVGRWMMFLSMK